MSKDFCIFILTHGRPDRLDTLRMLKRSGYTGDYFLVVDDEDAQKDAYIEKYGDKVLVFSKRDYVGKFDIGDNIEKRNVVVYARNACFDIAKRIGKKYFMQLDDDYTSISFRFNYKGEFKNAPVKDLDHVLEALLRFYKSTNITALAFAQGGDYIGGSQSAMGSKIFLKRKIMNTMLCSTERPFDYVGRINEDVNAYIKHGNRGELFFTTNIISINQRATQSNEGGLTDIYLERGTYVKSFYSILFCPSFVRIMRMGNKEMRDHHKIYWRYGVPCILGERWKNGETKGGD